MEHRALARGKGSHPTVYFGSSFTILRNPADELKSGTLHATRIATSRNRGQSGAACRGSRGTNHENGSGATYGRGRKRNPANAGSALSVQASPHRGGDRVAGEAAGAEHGIGMTVIDCPPPL